MYEIACLMMMMMSLLPKGVKTDGRLKEDQSYEKQRQRP